MDYSEIHKQLQAESDRLFGLCKGANLQLELYHREAVNLTFSKELYWTLRWMEYEG